MTERHRSVESTGRRLVTLVHVVHSPRGSPHSPTLMINPRVAARLARGAGMPSATKRRSSARKSAAPARKQAKTPAKKPTTKATAAKGARITVENVMSPGRTFTVDATKYAAMKRALLKVLPKKAPGLTQAEMWDSVPAHLPEAEFPGGAKAGWWVKCVQLDLEAKGVVIRETTSKPLRWHRAK